MPCCAATATSSRSSSGPRCGAARSVLTPPGLAQGVDLGPRRPRRRRRGRHGDGRAAGGGLLRSPDPSAQRERGSVSNAQPAYGRRGRSSAASRLAANCSTRPRISAGGSRARHRSTSVRAVATSSSALAAMTARKQCGSGYAASAATARASCSSARADGRGPRTSSLAPLEAVNSSHPEYVSASGLLGALGEHLLVQRLGRRRVDAQQRPRPGQQHGDVVARRRRR